MILDPPAIYDHPYPGEVRFHLGQGGEMTAIDGPCFPWLGSHACAKVIGGVCHIWVLKDKLTPALLRHELAHCNGWPADHPP